MCDLEQMTLLLHLTQPVSSPVKSLSSLLHVSHGLQRSQRMAVFNRSLFSPLVCFSVLTVSSDPKNWLFSFVF